VGRLRFVILGLVLGVLIAVVAGSDGCGSKHKQHAARPVVAAHA
jgi:hypothetical protein